ncbi:MAG: MazG nucleotide pyrophosphohydrolase domain-containing protein [Candidatus Paceibacterota bacterium]|jgi:NTP pyrophosphatase (non-canonical NTP hydrolase)
MKNHTLKELQTYFAEKSKERGFDKETAQDTLLLMMEEVGELARAVRKQSGIKTDNKSKIYPIQEELADILIYLLHISNILKLDLEESFWKKEEENKKRVWK